MQLSEARRSVVIGCWLVLLGLALTPSVRADETSGRWSGQVDLPRGNYYWERSTRVVAPAVRAVIESPVGVRIEGGYLIDAITSASQATGVATDVAFTEIRHDANVGVGAELDFGRTQLDLSVRGRRSIEPDYLSRGAGFSAALSLGQRNHVLRLNGYYLNDDVGKVVRDSPADDPDRLVAARREHIGTLQALSLGVSYERTLSPTTLLIAGADLAYLSGFQANVYRVVVPAGGGVPAPENHPQERTRGAAYVGFKQRLPVAGTTLGASYRIYRDTWEILSHAPELRVYQDLNEYLILRVRYRYYTQTAAYFYVPGGPTRDALYRTADPKMTAFHDHTIALNILSNFDYLAGTSLAFLAAARLDFGIAYLWNTNRFGDGLMGQAGLYFPF